MRRILFLFILINMVVLAYGVHAEEKQVRTQDTESEAQITTQAPAAEVTKVNEEIKIIREKIEVLEVLLSQSERPLAYASSLLDYSAVLMAGVALVLSLGVGYSLFEARNVKAKVAEVQKLIDELEVAKEEHKKLAKQHRKMFDWSSALELGKIAFDNGSFQLAIDKYWGAIQIIETDIAYIHLAQSYSALSPTESCLGQTNNPKEALGAKSKNLDDALKYTKKYFDYGKKHEDKDAKYNAKVLEIMIYAKQRKLDEAYDAYREAARMYEEKSDADSQMGLAYLVNRKFVEASEKLKEAIDKHNKWVNPMTPFVLIAPFALGCLKCHFNNPEESVEYFQKSLDRANSKIQDGDQSLMPSLLAKLSTMALDDQFTEDLDSLASDWKNLKKKGGYHELEFVLCALELVQEQGELPSGADVGKALNFVKELRPHQSAS